MIETISIYTTQGSLDFFSFLANLKKRVLFLCFLARQKFAEFLQFTVSVICFAVT